MRCAATSVFDPAASFYMLHKKMGVVPGWGGGVRLVGILGRSQALRLLANPRKLTPHECKDIGIADAVAPEEATLNRLYMRTSARIENPDTVRAIKRCVENAASHRDNIESALRYEQRIFAEDAWGRRENVETAKN